MCLDYLGLGPGPGAGQRQVGPGEVGLPLQRQDVGETGPLFAEGVVVAELWLRVLFVHPAEIVVGLIYSHHGRTLFPLVEMLVQLSEEIACPMICAPLTCLNCSLTVM